MTNKVIQLEKEDNFSIENIADKIKKNVWHKTINEDLLSYMQETTLEKYDIRDSTRYQSRSKTIDYEFIDRQVNKLINTGDKSYIEKPTLVYFEKETTLKFDVGDITYPSLSKIVIGGNHTIAILVRSGYYEHECNIISYDEYIKTHHNLMKLSNHLNLSYFEKQPLEDGSIRWEFRLLMDECREKTGTHKPTQEQQHEFIKTYPQVTQNTLNQLMSYHDEGGRGVPQKEYSDAELKEKEKYYRGIWPDHAVLIKSLSNYQNNVFGFIVNKMFEQQTYKIVLVLHSNRKRHDGLIATENDQQKVKDYIIKRMKFVNSAIDLVVTFLPNN